MKRSKNKLIHRLPSADADRVVHALRRGEFPCNVKLSSDT